MKEWLLFLLLIVVGIGMLVCGLFYIRKEKDNSESVQIYSTFSVIGVVLTIYAVFMKFAL